MLYDESVSFAGTGCLISHSVHELRVFVHNSPHTFPAMTAERIKLGAVGEQFAADHLEAKGFEILERNFRARFGEIDIVALHDHQLVFVEVKTRTRTGYSLDPLLSIGGRKRSQVRKLAQQWLLARPNHPRVYELRFDAVGVAFDAAGAFIAIEHVQAAF